MVADARIRYVRSVAAIVAAGLPLLLFSPIARGDELDLKKLFNDSIPDSPFIAVTYKYADAMLQYGRDTHGPKETGLFLSALDRKTLKPLESRPPAPTGVAESIRPGAAGEPLVGASADLDQNFLRLLYFLKDLSNESRYGQAADAELKWLLGGEPSMENGLPLWGAHISWDVVRDEAVLGPQEVRREFSRPWMLSDRCFELAPNESKAFALALRKHYTADSSGDQPAADHPRQAGFLIRMWADAFAHTHDATLLQAIDAVLTACEAQDFARDNSANRNVDSSAANAFHALSLAIDCDGAARKTPEPLRSRLTSLAGRIDAAFCAQSHDVSAEKGFAARLGSPAVAGPKMRHTSLWSPEDGKFTTAGVGVMCVSRYTNTGNIGYRELIVAAADAYLDSLPNDDVDAWPLSFGQAITLELAAFRITAKREYHDRAIKLGKYSVDNFFGDSPLPRASLKSGHYENTTGSDTLALALAEVHMSTRTITAVRIPSNTLDR